MRDYTGKTVYLGMDVHKKSYSVTAICDQEIIKKDRLEADPSLLLHYCKKYFPGAHIVSAYEAGFCGFALHRLLENHGLENNVVHPAGIEVAARDRVKTDKRDSMKIATHLSQGRLKGIYVPSLEQEHHREISRLRDALIRDRSRIATQLKSLLHRQGLFKDEHNKGITKKMISTLLEMDVSYEIHFSIQSYCDRWLYLTDQLKSIQEELLKQGEDDPIEAVYKSVPGIGQTTARILANELGDLSQFSNERKLFSYMGLTPQEHSSGEHRWLGHISRQGKPILRKILVLAAWRAIKEDPKLRETYERIALKSGGKKAIVGIARRLIGHARACFRKGCLYGS